MKKVIGSVLALGVLTSCSSSSTTRISAAGATFPAPLYQSWVNTLAQSGGPLVNYQAVGSGAGVRQFNAGTTDFGASDKAVEDDNEIPIVQIPMTGGAIVPAYNNPGCDLRRLEDLDSFILAIKKLFMEKKDLQKTHVNQ